MICTYALGVSCNLFYQRTIAITAQKFSMKLRIDMFSHMQDLPIKYFDTHKHGTIMSTYTNDTDNMWQLSSQSLPQLLTNSATILALFVMILVYSLYLGLVVIGFSIIMVIISKKDC
jgi:ATP-binding cassette subfamily B protein